MVSSQEPEPVQSVHGLHSTDDGAPPVGSEYALLKAGVRGRLFGGSEGPLRLGRFELEGRLGSGGMGVVYRATDPTLGRPVAIKVLRNLQGSGSEGEARLRREAQALARLAHPNVVVVHEVGEHAGELFVVMEYVAGETLGAWARRHDVDEIVAIYVAAGEGLAAAHAAGIVHRDFKPDNVLVGSDGRPRVVDFGLAGAAVERGDEVETASNDSDADVHLTATGTILGTPAYMAPEQHLGGRRVDAASDQFSFCVALWESLFGERPFEGDDLPSLRRSILRGKIRLPPPGVAVSSRRLAALRRGLSVDPQDRFANMTSLLAELRAPVLRSRGAWPVGLAIAAATLFGAAAWWQRNAASTEPPAQASSAESTIAAPSAPAAALPQLELRRLTNTPGYGLSAVFAGWDRTSIVYVAEGIVWRRPIAGGVPRKVEGELAEFSQFAVLPDDALAVVRGNALVRIDARGEERTLAELPREPTFYGRGLHAIADGRAFMVLTTKAIRTYAERDGELGPVMTLPIGDDIRGVAPRRDGERFLVAREIDDVTGALRLDLHDDGGRTLASLDDAHAHASGFAWLGADVIVGFAEDERGGYVQCYRVVGDRLELGARSAPFVERIGFNQVVDPIDEHTLLIAQVEDTRDAVVTALDPEHPTAPLAVKQIEVGAWSTAWLGPSELAFLTDRFGIRTLVRAELGRPSAMESMAEGAVEWTVSDGAGGLVYFNEDREARHRAADGTDRVVPDWFGPEEHFDRMIGCASPNDCVVLWMPAGTERGQFATIDLETGRRTQLGRCPPSLDCPGRWVRSTVSPSLAFGTRESERRAAVFDLASGDVVHWLPEPPPGSIVQSFIDVAEGEYLATGMLTMKSEGESGTYRLFHVGSEGKYTTLMELERTWMVRPRLSPDRRHVSFDGRSFHEEAALLEIGDLCSKP